MRNVRSSRLRPGMISARNVTCISGRAQVMTIGLSSVFFFLLNIVVGVDRSCPFLMLCLSLDRIGLFLRPFLAELLRRRSGRLTDRIEDRFIRSLSLFLLHVKRIIADEFPNRTRRARGARRGLMAVPSEVFYIIIDK